MSTRRIRTMRRTAAIVSMVTVTALAAAGCSGTSAPFDVNMRNASTAIILGKGGKAVVNAPVPPVGLPPKSGTEGGGSTGGATGGSSGGSIGGGVTGGTSGGSTGGSSGGGTLPDPTTPPPVTDSCAAPPAGGAPDIAADPDVSSMPATGSYKVRTDGLLRTDNKADQVSQEEATWTVEKPEPEWPGTFTYSQTVKSSGGTTKATYRVVPKLNEVNVPKDGRGAVVDGGIYLVAMESPGVNVKLPNPGALITTLDFGVQAQAVERATGNGDVTFRTSSRIVGQVPVPTCGAWLDSWKVDWRGTITGLKDAQGDVSFDATYYIAPQFGGLILASSSTVTGRDGDKEIARSVTTRPMSAPPQVNKDSSRKPEVCTVLPPGDTSIPLSGTKVTGEGQAAADFLKSKLLTGTGVYRSTGSSVPVSPSGVPYSTPWAVDTKVTESPAGGSTSGKPYTVTVTRTPRGGAAETQSFRIIPVGATQTYNPTLDVPVQDANGKDQMTPDGKLVVTAPEAVQVTLTPGIYLQSTTIAGRVVTPALPTRLAALPLLSGGQITYPDAAKQAFGTELPATTYAAVVPQVKGTILPAGLDLPPGTVLPKSYVMPVGTTVPAGTVLPKTSSLPKGLTLPVGFVLPTGLLLPTGLVMPDGTVLTEDKKLTGPLTLTAAYTLSAVVKGTAVDLPFTVAVALNKALTFAAPTTLPGPVTTVPGMDVSGVILSAPVVLKDAVKLPKRVDLRIKGEAGTFLSFVSATGPTALTSVLGVPGMAPMMTTGGIGACRLPGLEFSRYDAWNVSLSGGSFTTEKGSVISSKTLGATYGFATQFGGIPLQYSQQYTLLDAVGGKAFEVKSYTDTVNSFPGLPEPAKDSNAGGGGTGGDSTEGGDQ